MSDGWVRISEEQPRGANTRTGPRRIMSLVPPVGERPWVAEAACRGLDPDLFYPTDRGAERLAVALCRSCPVQLHCLWWAALHNDDIGIWGGATPKERENLRRRIQRRRRKRREATLCV